MTKAIVALIIVIFTKNWRAYAAGETAGFDEDTAEALIEGGYAVERNADTEAKSGTKATKSVAAAGKPPATKGKQPTKVAAANKPPAPESEVPEPEDLDKPEDGDETPPNPDDIPPLDPEEEKP